MVSPIEMDLSPVAEALSGEIRQMPLKGTDVAATSTGDDGMVVMTMMNMICLKLVSSLS